MTGESLPGPDGETGESIATAQSLPAIRPLVDATTIYYSGVYWNSYPVVRAQLGRLIAGDAESTWTARLQQVTGNRLFKRALILACGSGGIERSLIDSGICESALGLDISEELLAVARAATGTRRLRYSLCDLNVNALPEAGFDLVVCHSAAHHIACLHHAFNAVSRAMDSDAWLVGFDYTGADRNQYPAEQWSAAARVNAELPPMYRSLMRYPHLPTMLVTDPSEAVHSELVESALHRHFEVSEFRRLGGSIAYPLLTHNEALFNADPAEREFWSAHVMRADAEHLERRPEHNLFSFFLARPKAPPADLATLLEEERDRERAAVEQGGHYGPPTEFQKHMWRLTDEGPRAQFRMLRLTPNMPLRLGDESDLPLGPDWHEIEPWGCWAAVDRARLVIHCPPSPGPGMKLSLVCTAPPTRSGGETPLQIEIDERPLGNFGLLPGMSKTIDIPLAPEETGTPVMVTLALPRAYIPQEEADSADTRKLGVGILSVELTSDI